MYCTNCGSKMAEEDNFCRECGRAVRKKQPVQHGENTSYHTVPPQHIARETVKNAMPTVEEKRPQQEEIHRKIFCMNCGREVPYGMRFCMECGERVGAVSDAQKTEKPKKKQNIKAAKPHKRIGRTIGVILLVLQALALVGGMASGGLMQMLQIDSIQDCGVIVGYFLPAIIGLSLLRRDKKQNT